MQRVVQPVTAGIAGKYSASPIAAVSRRCQANDQQSGVWVTEPRNWTTPIFLLSKFSFAKSCDLGAVGPKSRTELACGDTVGQPGKGRRGDGEQVGILVRQTQEEALGASCCLRLYLGKNRQVGCTGGTTRVGYQPAYFNRQPGFGQSPGACPSSGARRGASAGNPHPPAQQTVDAQRVLDAHQRCLVGSHRNTPAGGQTGHALAGWIGSRGAHGARARAGIGGGSRTARVTGFSATRIAPTDCTQEYQKPGGPHAPKEPAAQPGARTHGGSSAS